MFYRLEQEKLAHKLERACSPTQDVAEFLDGEFSEEEEDIDYEEGLHEPEAEVPQVSIGFCFHFIVIQTCFACCYL